MNRRSVVRGGAVAVVAAVVPVLARAPAVTYAKETVRTAAIGLSRKTWEQEHGRGDAGQNIVTYENGAFSLQFAGDVVVYVEVGWEDRGGISAGDASGVVAQLIPSDAALKEGYYAPPTAAGPTGLRVERSQSPALADLMKQVTDDRTGGILVVYQEAPSQTSHEPNVFRISIAVGTKANSILDQPSGFADGLA
ncbi:MAG TPA: hypothetical protein VH482_18335 [Thermomicrobiales bacterium]